MSSPPDIADRSRGALLGSAIGEAHPDAGASAPGSATAAMLALADSLARRGELDDADLAKASPSALEADAVATPAWIAPLAVRFVHDYVVLYGRARHVARLARAPALEADAALVQVAALGAALLDEDPLVAAAAAAETRELRRRIPALATREPSLDVPIGDARADATAGAIVAATSSTGFEDALEHARGSGAGAMLGALAGARSGASGIPAPWIESLDSELRQRALALAEELERQARTSAPRMYRIPVARRR
jgi:hypothetical protein